MMHQWVELTYMPVEVTESEENGERGLRVAALNSSIELAAQDRIYACWHCSTPLSMESFNTDCSVEQMIDV